MKPTHEEIRSFLDTQRVEATALAVEKAIRKQFGRQALDAAFVNNYVDTLKHADIVGELDKLCASATRVSRNVHDFRFRYDKHFKRKVLLVSDLHWDNPKCDRVLLKKHLDQAKAENALILLNGDTFCLMQGAYDPRKSKSDIRPEHNKADYFDAIIRTAVEWFGPYAENIALVCRGNHETSILKRQETDMVQRFVDMMNMVHKPLNPIFDGGYGGWVRFVFDKANGNTIQTHKLKYYHGSGGGGPVTKGIIQTQRQRAFIEGADITWNGHVHDEYITYDIKETLSKNGIVTLKEICFIRTATYKEEYADGNGGWHVERGAPPKPLGGAWLEFFYEQEKIKFNAWKAK